MGHNKLLKFLFLRSIKKCEDTLWENVVKFWNGLEIAVKSRIWTPRVGYQTQLSGANLYLVDLKDAKLVKVPKRVQQH